MSLYDFYNGRLPSISERSKIYEQYGLGSAGSYYGTASQNQALEARLRAGSPTKTAAKKPAPKRVDPFQTEINRATGLFAPVRKAGAAAFKAQKGRIGADFKDLEARLREDAMRGEGALTENMNKYGLLQSGRTAAGLGKIQSDLVSNLSRKDIERTIAEADLALKEAGFNADIGAKTIDTAKSFRQDAFTGSKLAQDLLQSPTIDTIPDNILRQILTQYGFTVTD